MKVKATSAGKKIDLRDRCGKLNLQPACEAEQELLSAMYKAMVSGGTIIAKPAGEKTVKVVWYKT